MNSVSIATKPLVYQTFRFIDNKVWNALGEYVDNSISSFLYHKELLSRINPENKLRVEIWLDLDNDTITIEDNAFGIDEDNYQRAFQLAELPLDTTNLNEFGMGMKVSSIWLCDLWTVESTAYGEPVKKVFTFDLKEVIRDQKESLEYETQECEAEEHYTRITLKKLSKKAPSTRQITFIKTHLADMYIKYIRDGVLDLCIDGVPLSAKNLEVLNAPYYKDEDGEPKEWIHKIDLPKIPKMDNGVQIGWYKVSGFIGLLATQSTSIDNGIFLFHKGRVVDNSNEGKYRPKELCGEVGSPRYKRVFGELELEGYDVTYTKNAFNEDDDFHQLILDIKQDIVDRGDDFFGQAQHYIKPRSEEDKKDYANRFISSIANGGDKVEGKSRKRNKENKPISLPAIVVPEIESSNDPEISEASYFLSEPQIMEVTISGSTIRLKLSATEDTSSNNLYSVKQLGDTEFEAVINWKNTYFKKIDFSISEQLDSVAYFIKIMVLTEVMLRIKGTTNSGAFRNTFNGLFGQVN